MASRRIFSTFFLFLHDKNSRRRRIEASIFHEKITSQDRPERSDSMTEISARCLRPNVCFQLTGQESRIEDESLRTAESLVQSTTDDSNSQTSTQEEADTSISPQTETGKSLSTKQIERRTTFIFLSKR